MPWFFELLRMSISSGVSHLPNLRRVPSGIGGCMNAGLDKSSTTRVQGSSFGKSGVRPCRATRQASSSGSMGSAAWPGGEPGRSLSHRARQASWHRNACQGWEWCGMTAGKAATSSRWSAASTPGRLSFAWSPSRSTARMQGSVIRFAFMVHPPIFAVQNDRSAAWRRRTPERVPVRRR